MTLTVYINSEKRENDTIIIYTYSPICCALTMHTEKSEYYTWISTPDIDKYRDEESIQYHHHNHSSPEYLCKIEEFS